MCIKKGPLVGTRREKNQAGGYQVGTHWTMKWISMGLRTVFVE